MPIEFDSDVLCDPNTTTKVKAAHVRKILRAHLRSRPEVVVNVTTQSANLCSSILVNLKLKNFDWSTITHVEQHPLFPLQEEIEEALNIHCRSNLSSEERAHNSLTDGLYSNYASYHVSISAAR